MDKYSDIIINPLASSTREEQYLLSCNGQYYEANLPIVELVKELQGYSTEEEAIVAYISKKKGLYSSEQVHQIINKFITPIFSSKEKKRTFLYEKEIFSATVISRFSNACHFLFNKVYIISVLVIAMALNTYFFLTIKDMFLFNNEVNLYMIVGLFAFMIASSFFHELGHATACKFFGVGHGGVGFGLYLNFPVLYTDVTEAWELSRKQRCVVNIAGVYFQSYCLIILLVAFQITGNDIIRYLILIMNLGFLMTLNPFFKFDGYWIASDLLGVPNLRARSLELLGYWYKRICGLPVSKVPYLLQIRPVEKYGLLIYSIVVNLFMSFYFFYIIPHFIYRFVRNFPDQINELILYLSNNLVPPFVLMRNIGAQLIFLMLLGYLFWNVFRSLMKKYVRK